MLLLTSTSDLLQVVTGQAVPIDVHASWVDNAAGTITPGRTNTAISTAATTTVVASPGALTQRNLQTLIVRNRDAAASCDVTVKHTDGATAVELIKVTLLAGYELEYLDGVGFSVFNTLAQLLSAGATGLQGPTGLILPPSYMQEDPDDQFPPVRIPSGFVSRAALAADAKPWTFLGTVSGTGVTVGPLIWTGQFQQIHGEYIIGGYNGGTPVGRLLCGAASIATASATNGNGLMEGGTPNATSVSAAGCPLAVTASAIARMGHFFISGASGALKQIRIHGLEGNPAVATSPVIFEGRSFFSDLGTNLLLQRLQLSVYDLLTGTTISTNAFTAPTALWAWGRNND